MRNWEHRNCQLVICSWQLPIYYWYRVQTNDDMNIHRLKFSRPSDRPKVHQGRRSLRRRVSHGRRTSLLGSLHRRPPRSSWAPRRRRTRASRSWILTFMLLPTCFSLQYIYIHVHARRHASPFWTKHNIYVVYSIELRTQASLCVCHEYLCMSSWQVIYIYMYMLGACKSCSCRELDYVYRLRLIMYVTYTGRGVLGASYHHVLIWLVSTVSIVSTAPRQYQIVQNSLRGNTILVLLGWFL